MIQQRRARGVSNVDLEIGAEHPQPAFMPGNGLVGGVQCAGWYCAEPGCRYVFISALGRKSPKARCPRHKESQ